MTLYFSLTHGVTWQILPLNQMLKTADINAILTLIKPIARS